MTYTFPVARRIQDLPNYPFVAIGNRIQALQKQGVNILRMDMGSPDLPPPPAVIESMSTALADPDMHGYSGYRGTPQFRKAIAEYYQRRFGVTIDPETQVLPLLGSKEGIVNLMLALVGRDDAVLVPSLSYPAYGMGAILAEAETVHLPMKEEYGFLPQLEHISATDRQKARLLWLNFPNNPTSVFADLDYYQHAVKFCRENHIILGSDNAYVEVVFDQKEPAPSVLQVPGATDVAVEFLTFSKSYNMAGWRLGAAVGNAEAIAMLLKVKSNVDSGHFKAIYEAGITALQTPDSWIQERNARYAKRRDMILAAAEDIRIQVNHPPKGALYIWGKVKGMSDTEYVNRALEEAGVSMAPGSLYGEDGEGFIRLSLGIHEDQLEEALERLKQLFS